MSQGAQKRKQARCKVRAKTYFIFLPFWCGMVWQEHLGVGMTFSLAFSNLAADAPRQRVRCAVTGRFVAWVKAPQLRTVVAARVVVAPPVVVPVAVVAPAVETVSAPPVDAVAVVAAVVTSVASTIIDAVTAIADTVAAAGGWFKRSALRIARRVVVAAVIAAHPAVAPAVGGTDTRLEAVADASGWGCPM